MNILVSACLLGVACRYDGKSKPNPEVLKLVEKFNLIPICPEQLGGLPTPRIPSEISNTKVLTSEGKDVTLEYKKGATEALKIANIFNCKLAILKEKSPSCGCGKIYDGNFNKTLIVGNGITAQLFLENGINVIGETSIQNINF